MARARLLDDDLDYANDPRQVLARGAPRRAHPI
jgi:hypothetical protein